MSKQFRNCDLNQAYLLPPSLQEWLPEGHLARFVADLVETLDLSAIYAKYEEGDGRGLAAYDPRMMVRLLIHAYCRGVPGSRRIERTTYEDVGFRYLAADRGNYELRIASGPALFGAARCAAYLRGPRAHKIFGPRAGQGQDVACEG
jgi:transposase